jgi:hypothetical protein
MNPINESLFYKIGIHFSVYCSYIIVISLFYCYCIAPFLLCFALFYFFLKGSKEAKQSKAEKGRGVKEMKK